MSVVITSGDKSNITSIAGIQFYDSLDKQFRFQKQCETCDLHAYKVPNYQLPAFVFSRDTYFGAIDSFQIINAEDNTLVLDLNVDTLYADPDIRIYPSAAEEKDYIVYRGLVIVDPDNANANYLLACGCYYLKIVSSNKIYFSEVFCSISNEDIVYDYELARNGDFAQAFFGWTANAGMSISVGGMAELATTIPGNTLVLSQNISAFSGIKWKVTFTIDDFVLVNPGSMVRVSVADNRIFDITADGSYYFYADSISKVWVTAVDGATFKIDDISINPVIGMKEYVTVVMKNICRGANAIDENFIDRLWLDAMILEPEYGEVIKQNENGDFEQVNSFARAFKRFDLSPMLLPECIVDTLAKANTFDYFGINNGADELLYLYGNYDLGFIPIQNFSLKSAWQSPSCYSLVNFNFEQTIAMKNTCCDEIVIDTCVELDELDPLPSIQTPENVNAITTFTPVTDLPSGYFVELFLYLFAGTIADCDAIDLADYDSTHVVVTSDEFNADGITYRWNILNTEDIQGCAYVRIFKPGCTNEMNSNKVYLAIA